jgi:hypothetical protein
MKSTLIYCYNPPGAFTRQIAPIEGFYFLGYITRQHTATVNEQLVMELDDDTVALVFVVGISLLSHLAHGSHVN